MPRIIIIILLVLLAIPVFAIDIELKPYKALVNDADMIMTAIL